MLYNIYIFLQLQKKIQWRNQIGVILAADMKLRFAQGLGAKI